MSRYLMKLTAILIAVLWVVDLLACTPTDLIRAIQTDSLKYEYVKNRTRGLAQYSAEIFFPRSQRHSPASVGMQITNLIDSQKLRWSDEWEYLGIPFERWVRALIHVRGRKVHWVDVAGGAGRALYEIRKREMVLPKHLLRTNVDAIDWVGEGEPTILENLTFLGDKIQTWKPNMIVSDASRFKLETPADLQTLMNGLVYMEDKLGVIAHMYNQAADNGYLVISSEQAFSQQMSGMSEFIESLGKAGIPIALTIQGEIEWCGNNAGVLLLQKVPGTALRVNATYTGERLSMGGYFAEYSFESNPITLEPIPN